MRTVLIVAAVSVVGIAAGFLLVRLFWRVRSIVQVRQAVEKPARAQRMLIWRDPGPVEPLDLAAGQGGPDGAPVPPFRFVEEHLTGSSPSVSVQDEHCVSGSTG